MTFRDAATNGFSALQFRGCGGWICGREAQTKRDLMLLQVESVDMRPSCGLFLKDVVSINGCDGLELLREVFGHWEMFNAS